MRSRVLSRRSARSGYSTDGNIPLEDLFRILATAGTVDVLVEPYKRYRVSAPRMSEKSHNAEFVVVVDLNGQGSAVTAADFIGLITGVEDSALARSASNGVQNSLFE